MDNVALSKRPDKNNLWVLGILWVLTFIIYLPAVKAGWVTDSTDWLYNIRHLSFLKYINNAQSEAPVFHQFTQLTSYVFYKIFHANPYAWDMIQVTIHAVNCYLLFVICTRLFDDSGIKNGKTIALWGVLLYVVCPHISEAIIWKAAFDYLQGFLLLLLILLWVQQFQKIQNRKYAWLAGIVYLCATWSFEIFYLTPWFVLALTLYYHYVLKYEAGIFRKTLLWFLLPQMILLAIRLTVMAVAYSHSSAMINVWQPFSTYISRPPEYLFHILFLGRYFDDDTRKQVYEMLSSNAGLIIFYNIIVLVCCYLFPRLKFMGAAGKAGTLLFIWAMISSVILMPLKFPETSLVLYDRYTYFLSPFVYIILALLANNITNKYTRYALLAAYALLNLYFTIQINIEWKHAAYIDYRIVKNLPNPGNRTVVFLNLPYHLNGVPMLPATQKGAYKRLYEMYNGPVNNKMYDAESYNMLTPKNGAHVLVINDSTVRVTLNQWATWWWYVGYDGKSYENDDYKVDMIDPGHWYDIILKHPHSGYLLVFQTGDELRQVDWNKVNVDQY